MAAAKKKTQEQKALHIEVVRQMLTLATSGFGLVAALAWNNFIQTLVSKYVQRWFKADGELISLLVYAVIVTALAVFITLQLSKLLRRLESEKND